MDAGGDGGVGVGDGDAPEVVVAEGEGLGVGGWEVVEGVVVVREVILEILVVEAAVFREEGGAGFGDFDAGDGLAGEEGFGTGTGVGAEVGVGGGSGAVGVVGVDVGGDGAFCGGALVGVDDVENGGQVGAAEEGLVGEEVFAGDAAGFAKGEAEEVVVFEGDDAFVGGEGVGDFRVVAGELAGPDDGVDSGGVGGGD